MKEQRVGKLLRLQLKREIPSLAPRDRDRRFGYLIAALCCVGLACAALYVYGAL